MPANPDARVSSNPKVLFFDLRCNTLIMNEEVAEEWDAHRRPRIGLNEGFTYSGEIAGR
jgi:hypothetical protein